MKSVVLCGSSRFKSEMRAFAAELKAQGVLVYEPYLHYDQAGWDTLSDDYKKFATLGLTHDHLYKIRMADVLFVYNKDGYVGNSTTLEIGAALALNKPIYAFHIDDEWVRQTLFRAIVVTPAELIRYL
jgi:hypothetical protein